MESPNNEKTKSQLAISCHQMKPPVSEKGYIKFFFQKVLGQNLIIKTLRFWISPSPQISSRVYYIYLKTECLVAKGSLPLLILIFINKRFVTLVYNKTLF